MDGRMHSLCRYAGVGSMATGGHGIVCLLTTLCVVLSMGCGSSNPPTFPVSGVVRFPDGKPMADGTIEFELIDATALITATADLDSEGRFVLGTYELDDGARPGDYRVAIYSSNVLSDKWERPGRIQRPVLHPRFESVATSKLALTVAETENEFTIEVDYTDAQ